MAIDPRVDIGHVHLKVSDIDRALGFYCGVLGFELQQRLGDQAAFISAGGYHHHIGLNTWESAGAPPPPRNTTGLYHVAIRYPDRQTLADALHRLVDAGIPLDGASDHGVSEALYLRDPDDNGIELYRDRPRDEWPLTADGELRMVSDRLDVAALLREPDADGSTGGAGNTSGNSAERDASTADPREADTVEASIDHTGDREVDAIGAAATVANATVPDAALRRAGAAAESNSPVPDN